MNPNTDPDTGHDWPALVLQRIIGDYSHAEPDDEHQAQDPRAWRLAYACLTAHRGQVEPPEVLAEVVAASRTDRMLIESQRMTIEALIKRVQALESAVSAWTPWRPQ